MIKRCGLKFLILIFFFLSGTVNATDLLMPIQPGDRTVFRQYYEDNPSVSWTVTAEVVGPVNKCSETYYHMKYTNYYNSCETQDIYLRSTENEVYQCIEGVECISFQDAPIGTTWECGDHIHEIADRVDNVSVPYGGPYSAIVVKHHKTIHDPPVYWHTYNYIVPGIGMIKEVDYWNEQYPTAAINELMEIQHNPQTVIFGQDSAQITHPFLGSDSMLAAIGGWSLKVGGGSFDQDFSYSRIVGTEFVSGATIGGQVFCNIKCLKLFVINSHNNSVVTVSMAQDTEGNVWVLKVHDHINDDIFLLGGIYKSMFMPAVPTVGASAALIIPEEPEGPCTVEEIGIGSLETRFGTYTDCIKINCRNDSFEYYCRETGEVRQSLASSPSDAIDLKEIYPPENLGDATGDGTVSLEDPIFSLQVLTGIR